MHVVLGRRQNQIRIKESKICLIANRWNNKGEYETRNEYLEDLQKSTGIS